MKSLYIAGGVLLVLWLAASGKKAHGSKTSDKVLDIRDFDNLRNTG